MLTGAVASVRMMKLRLDVHIARFLHLIPVVLRPGKVPFAYARHVRDVCAADARIAVQIASNGADFYFCLLRRQSHSARAVAAAPVVRMHCHVLNLHGCHRFTALVLADRGGRARMA